MLPVAATPARDRTDSFAPLDRRDARRRAGRGDANGVSPPSAAAMLVAVRGGAGVNGAASPPSTRAMLDAVRGDAGDASSPPSVAAMLAAVRGEPVPSVEKPRPADAPREEPVTPTAGRPSVAAILAAARAKDGGDAPAKPQAVKAGGKKSVADILAAARAADGGVKPAAKPPAATKRPSTADILAKTRGKAAPAKIRAVAAEPAAPVPPPVPLSVPEMVAQLRAKEGAAVVPARPPGSRRGWWARLFGSKA